MLSIHAVRYEYSNEMVLKVKLLMKIDIEKKGAKYITNSWSVGRRLRHVEVK